MGDKAIKSNSVDLEQFEQSLEKFRTKLLDLTTRNNNLLSFRETKRSIRIVDEFPNIILTKLVAENKSMKVIPFKPPEFPNIIESNGKNINGSKIVDKLEIITGKNEIELSEKWGLAPFQIQFIANKVTSCSNWEEVNKIYPAPRTQVEAFAHFIAKKVFNNNSNPKSINNKHNNINTNNELPNDYNNVQDKHLDNNLQTPHISKQLQKRGINIIRYQKSAIEETGINILYLAMGFLKWKQADTSEDYHKAPLVMIPINVDKSRIGRSGLHSFYVTYSREDIEYNLCLAEKLSRDFGVNLPTFEDLTNVEDYFDLVAKAINEQDNWKVEREIVISLFSFSKIRMYRDLDLKEWKTGKLYKHNIIRNILLGDELKTGTERGVKFGDDKIIDEDHILNKIPLILEADSSQCSALIETVDKGYSQVVHGPPGTGKSQTIANMIACYLNKNKKVLFVAEKKAALEVVRTRLESVGLGNFCLELHSNKTKKGLLYKDLLTRLNCCFDKPSDLRQKKLHLQKETDKLKNYFKVLNESKYPIGEPNFIVLWAAERYRPDSDKLKINFSFPNASKTERQQLIHFKGNIEDFARLNLSISQDVKNAWEGYFVKTIFREDVDEINELMRKAIENIDGLNSLIDANKIPDMKALHLLLKIDSNINLLNDDLPVSEEKLIKLFVDVGMRGLFNKYKTNFENYVSIKTQLQEILISEETFVDEKETAEISNVATKLAANGYQLIKFKELKALKSELEMLIASILKCSDGFDNIGHLIASRPKTLKQANAVAEMLNVAMDPPKEAILYANKNHAMALTKIKYEEMVASLENLKNDKAKLNEKYDADSLTEYVDLESTLKVLKEPGKLARFLSRNYRKTNKNLKTFLRTNNKPYHNELIDMVESVLMWNKAKDDFSENLEYKKLFGEIFKGIDTDVKILCELIDWSQELTKIIGSEVTARNFIEKLQENITFLNQQSSFLLDELRTIDRYCVANKIEPDNFILHDFKEKAELVVDLIDNLISTTNNTKISPEATIGDLTLLEEFCKKYVFYKQELDKNYTFLQAWDSKEVALADKLKKIEMALQYVIYLEERVCLPKKTIKWLANGKYIENIKSLNNTLEKLKDWKSIHTELVLKLKNIGELDETKWYGYDFKNIDIDIYSNKLKQSLKCVKDLLDWADYVRSKDTLERIGFGELTRIVMENALKETEASDLLHYYFYNTLARDLMRSEPILMYSQGALLSKNRERMKALDAEIKELNRKEIAYNISNTDVPAGHRGKLIKEFTDLALIKHEVSKQKRHIPIRQLVKRAGDALLALKPCFMMSPMSVAQYLRPEALNFDVVIMDEASQLKVEDAIGAIARADQVVIVGDPKQLPPTDFFQRMYQDDDDEELLAAEAAESILDISQEFLRNTTLNWHYRSDDERLIAFSNHEFYDDNLIVIPTPFKGVTDTGVFHHYIEGAHYAGRKNIKEAQTVVNAIVDHYKNHQQYSLGVATFNITQRNLIADLLDKKLKDYPEIEDQIAKLEDTEHSFFVKNLENVQGDERDVIFISTTYGPDKSSGKVYQRFGPLNSEVGWRRLNVIVTRAKKQMHVFTSMYPHDILIGKNSNRGPIALRRFLEYASSGEMPEYGIDTGRNPDSHFEIAVSKILHQHGYRTAYQVGVAGFFIDIGVLHPYSDEYILGVECDGATYHSSRSARDRDLLRQSILESKGWKIHRIWSTDWFKNPDREIEKLIETIQTIIGELKAKRKDEPKIGADAVKDYTTGKDDDIDQEDIWNDELKTTLFELRKQKIKPYHNNLDETLLSDAIIDELIKRKPTTTKEFQQIPYEIREKIKHGSKLLEEVLQIISDYV